MLLLNQQDPTWKERLADKVSQSLLKPFDESILQFLHELSKTILRDKTMRLYPELMAMAHWLRPVHLKEIQQQYARLEKADTILLPRGVVLHFAPSNVDTIFIYSWVLSMLVGNINIVRLSQNRGPQIEVLLSLLQRLLEKDEYAAIKSRTVIVSYDHNEAITAYLSSLCQMRVIWGGDETVKRIRSIPLPPAATEMVFADRFSCAALSAEAVLELEDKPLQELLRNFYNDAFWFDQLACSSPKLVCWVGAKEERIVAAKDKFWRGLQQIIPENSPLKIPAVGIKRMTAAYHYATLPAALQASVSGTELPARVQIARLEPEMREMHCGAGLFLELHAGSLSELAEQLTLKDQTLTVFGFAKTELVQFVRSAPRRSVDRIVPIGQALDFSPVWDGYNLLQYFSREVAVNVL
nr:acyl-CoA reductase [Brevibacillus fulvus]